MSGRSGRRGTVAGAVPLQPRVAGPSARRALARTAPGSAPGLLLARHGSP
ncbi:hypothetical protein [Streptomyces sp. NRRL F-5630]